MANLQASANKKTTSKSQMAFNAKKDLIKKNQAKQI